MINPVAPVEGHYARMKDGAVVGPIRNASAWYTNSTDKWGCWHTDFLWDNTGRLSGKAYDPDFDIIATISPEAMALAAVTADGIDIMQDGPTDTATVDPMPGENAFSPDEYERLWARSPMTIGATIIPDTRETATDDVMRAAITAALEASSDYPTPEAYEAACKALWKHREELERLRAALKALYDGLAWDWRGHPVGDLPTLREIARKALAKMEESK
jgi:hypothetical protein